MINLENLDMKSWQSFIISWVAWVIALKFMEQG